MIFLFCCARAENVTSSGQTVENTQYDSDERWTRADPEAVPPPRINEHGM